MTGPGTGWTTAEDLARLLEAQRDALTAQIEALRASQDTSTEDGRKLAILCDYLITGSSSEAATWANDMGWKAVSRRTGAPCDYTGGEVLAMLNDPPASVPREFIALARRVRRRNS